MSKSTVKKAGLKEHEEVLHVCVGFSCSYSCVFCMEKGNSESDSVREFCKEKIYTVLRDNRNTKKILFTRGEPTFNPELVDYVVYARDQGNTGIAMISNGRKFSDIRYCLELVEAGMREFIVSIHGHNEKVHDALTLSPGSFAQTAQGLQNLVRLKQDLPITIHISHVVNRLNYKFLDKFLMFIQGHFIDEVIFNTVQPLGKNIEQNFSAVVPRYTAVARKIEEVFENNQMLFRSTFKPLKWNVTIVDMPLCVSQKVVHLIGFCEKAAIADLKKERKWGVVPFKEKRDACLDCAQCSVCEGVYSNYIQHFGWDEFVPVEK